MTVERPRASVAFGGAPDCPKVCCLRTTASQHGRTQRRVQLLVSYCNEQFRIDFLSMYYRPSKFNAYQPSRENMNWWVIECAVCRSTKGCSFVNPRGSSLSNDNYLAQPRQKSIHSQYTARAACPRLVKISDDLGFQWDSDRELTGKKASREKEREKSKKKDRPRKRKQIR